MTDFIRAILLWVLIWFLPVAGLSLGFYFLTTIPARRNEKARLFLDLLASGMDDGHSPEETVVSVSKTRERSLGARFHLVAAYIEQGCRLPVAVDQVPSFLPAGAAGLLQAGEASGNYPRCIAAARHALESPLTRTTAALHYGFVLLCLLVPTALFLLPFWQFKIWPVFQQIFADMSGAPLPRFSEVVTENTGWLITGYAGLAILLLIAFAIYLLSPRLFSHPRSIPGRIIDRCTYTLSWHRKRLHRDFSLCLSMLLEKNFPEPQAILLAGKGTGNRHLVRVASKMAEKTESGVPLPEALRVFDESGEFRWRVANALQGGGFLPSLQGWHESLEAEAWRREETAAHILSAALLIMNGAFIGLFMSAVFLVLVTLIHEEALW